MFQCDHDYCPHLHFKKCLNARLQSIPYTIFPDGTIDSFTNVPVKKANLYKSNIPTVAYENYTLAQGATEDDRNFVRDYYFDDNKQVQNLVNNLVQDQRQDMCTRSAYVLANSESEKYAQQSRKKAAALNNARRRAISRYNQHFRSKNQQKQIEDEQNAKWLKKLYRKLEQVARHIIEGDGQNIGERQKQFLLSKINLNANYLSQIKVRNPKVACQLLQEVRTLMLKKKLKLEDQRQQQEHNKSATMSFASQSGITSNTSQNSMLSEATSLNESNVFGEDQVASKFCDFEQLKKKWKLEDIQEVKEMLRRILTRKIVSEAEVQAVKKRKQAQKNNSLIRTSLQKRSELKKSATNSKQNQSKSVKKVQTIIMDKTNLNKQEMKTKQTLTKGGQFDAVGQKFQRNRNYSDMFKKREQANTVEFVFRNKMLSFSKDCCCSTQA